MKAGKAHPPILEQAPSPTIDDLQQPDKHAPVAVIGSTVQFALKLHAEIVAEHLSLRRAEAREILIKVAREFQ